MLERQDVRIDRSNLAFWVGYAAAEIAPVVARLREIVLASARIFADETVVPVLDPGRGLTKKGFFWAIARHDRPWEGRVRPRSSTPTRPVAGKSTRLLSCAAVAACSGAMATPPTSSSVAAGRMGPR